MRKSYTPTDRVRALAVQLTLLRDSLIRTTFSDLAFADLIRALRVLVLDDGDALLPQLADHFRVDHSVTTSPPIQPATSSGIDPDTGALLMPDIGGFVNTDPFSRWRHVRGLHPPHSATGLVVSFPEYLQLSVGVHRQRGTAISRKRMLADLAEQYFGVHGSTAREGHVGIALLHVGGGPQYMWLAQELAYETLDYGKRVLEVASDRLNLDVYVSAGIDFPRLDPPACANCGAPLTLSEFQCRACGATSLGGVRPDESAMTLGELIREAQSDTPWSMAFIGSIPGLFDSNVPPFVLADVEGDGWRARLTRDANRHLVWTCTRDGRTLSAAVDLFKRPTSADPGRVLLIILSWEPERVCAYVVSDPPDFWATSDGSRPTFLPSAN
jgi:hypothetical protein